MSSIAKELLKKYPQFSSNLQRQRTLYDLLKTCPDYGVGKKVVPIKYVERSYPSGSYYEITRVKLKPESGSEKGGTHGLAWARHYWKGRPTQEKEEKVRGGLKSRWVVVS
ncbi:hypothetical protein BKA69DRAFT_1128624 [Paraphysoderma sedebokerense]|nr:hypothetical protein BKA69DRAFT_1128624 [Paraphysoderma sedebokerense]